MTQKEDFIVKNDLLAEPLTGSRIPVLVTARPHRFPVNPRTCDHSCLAKVDVRPIFQERSKHFRVMYLNARSVGNKAPEVCDLIVEGNYDVIFLTETWLKTLGSEATIAELTPLGFSIKSMPRTTGTGGGVAVLYRNSLVSNINFVNLDSPYRTFQMCEVRLQYQGQSLLFVCLYRPPPSKKNKLTPKMFVDDVEDLINTLVPLPKFTLLGDINLWYDSVSDHYACTLKTKLSDQNLSQLVNVPTQKKGHILDWIITNQPEDIIDLTVVDKQISDHFLISFSLRLCKPRRRTREVTSRKLKDIDLDVFKADVTTSLSIISPDAGDQAAQLNTCLGELLDLHAPLMTRRVTDRTSAPWMTLDIKAAKQERRRTERQWQQTGLTVHRQIYCHERNIVSGMIRDAKRQYVCDKIVGADSSKKLFKEMDFL
ncbi:hypothetical protein ACOMHN_017929 [Nucella lapillus]